MRDPYNSFLQRLFFQNENIIKLELGPVKQAIKALSSPCQKIPVIMIGGTNGKGGTASYLANILNNSGYRVGLFTSPHLRDYSERFRIDGISLSPAEILKVGVPIFERFGASSEETTRRLTFFELTLLIGLVLFEQHRVDVCVMEIGLGGRLDAVNALEPDLTVLTSVSMDHMQYLGNTLHEIATEKAAIIAPGVPVVTSAIGIPLDVIANQAHKMGSPLLRVEREVMPEMLQKFLVSLGRELTATTRLNMVTAIQAALVWLRCQDRSVEPEVIRRAIKNTFWPCRFQILDGNPTVVLDVAHNPDGIQKLVRGMGRRFPGRPVFPVFGVMKDKDYPTMLRKLTELGDELWVCSLKQTRAVDPIVCQEIVPDNVNCRITEEPEQAFWAACEAAKKNNGIVLVCGSIYLLGELLEGPLKELEVDNIGIAPELASPYLGAEE